MTEALSLKPRWCSAPLSPTTPDLYWALQQMVPSVGWELSETRVRDSDLFSMFYVEYHLNII